KQQHNKREAEEGKSAKFNHFESDDDDESEDEEGFQEDPMEYAQQDEFEAMGITAEDERALENFMPSHVPQRKTLGEMIMEKLAEKNMEHEENYDETLRSGMNPQIVEVYTSVGKLLSRFRAGKLPKAFKIIP